MQGGRRAGRPCRLSASPARTATWGPRAPPRCLAASPRFASPFSRPSWKSFAAQRPARALALGVQRPATHADSCSPTGNGSRLRAACDAILDDLRSPGHLLRRSLDRRRRERFEASARVQRPEQSVDRCEGELQPQPLHPLQPFFLVGSGAVCIALAASSACAGNLESGGGRRPSRATPRKGRRSAAQVGRRSRRPWPRREPRLPFLSAAPVKCLEQSQSMAEHCRAQSRG